MAKEKAGRGCGDLDRLGIVHLALNGPEFNATKPRRQAAQQPAAVVPFPPVDRVVVIAGQVCRLGPTLRASIERMARERRR